ncbi:penicillin-insensitive murein endopeptidase [Agaricicola taiwanensis]|uniref:Penicillin-insensitive murein endopeptidase n=1 Tax=Agaricicola taiwanensis TaxID=591372 RepID=A0A8J3DYC1_9RHOB|nr:penicillin-insensitive murein endopeptidase [Agaricicola taiwanensis]GGE49859.1 penicillin-insensitive murein endopeptidase [Agaricicola taiwanensis]
MPVRPLAGAAALMSLMMLTPAGAQVPQPVPRPQPAALTAVQPIADAPAKELFGRVTAPAAQPPLAARSIGFYSKGCVAGAKALPIDGATWQVMRLSRNRNWGHPDLIAVLEHLAMRVPRETSWPGLLVGDISQPRGGPMLTGHASHQIGLDADVWLNPMPPRRLSGEEREKISAISVVAKDWLDIDPNIWTPDHLKVIRLAALEPRVERVLVNPAIKKALCREAGSDRSWLSKVRPYWGHNYHMHIRITCPAGSDGCRPQAAPPRGDGCGSDLAWWFTDEVMNPKKPAKPVKPKPPMTLAALPPACRSVLVAP